MEIIYLHQYFNTPSMVGGTRSYELARRLVQRGHRVRMVTSIRDVPGGGAKQGGWYETEESGISVHWLSVPYSNAMNYQSRVKAFFEFAIKAGMRASKLKGDVVFATSTPLTIALPAVYTKKKLQIPMVFEVRDLWPNVPIALGVIRNPAVVTAARWLEKFAYEHSERVVALSPGMREGIIRTGYPARNVHVIPNSSDIDLFTVPEEMGIEFRKRFSWLQDRLLVVYAGALGLVNGVSYLARLAAAVKQVAPEIRFLVIGLGAEADAIQKLAERLHVLNQNFFMMKPLPKNKMPAVFSAATIALSLVINNEALWMNSANKLFDAFASGTPVGINHGGWQADILKENDAGIILHPTNVDAAARTLLDALRDKEWIKRAGSNSKKLAQEQFNRDNLARQLEKVLASVVKSSGSSSASSRRP